MAWDRHAYSNLTPEPFVAWLNVHGFLHPGCSWSCDADPATGEPVYRRRNDPGPAWPEDRIAGALIVRPKRKALALT